MDDLLKDGISGAFRAADYRLCERQQSGTDSQFCFLRGFQVDLESNLVFLKAEADHPAFLDKVFRLSYCQDGIFFDARQDCGKELFLLSPDEQDLATVDFLRPFEMQHSKRSRSDCFSTQARVQCPVKRVTTDRAIR